MRDAYIPGDHWIICDVCGFKVRSSRTRKRWDGLMVCDADWEPRHPQDFVRGRSDRQTVAEARPELTDTFVGPLQTTTTAAAAAGGTTISVTSSVRMAAGDHVEIMLSDGNVHRAVLHSVPGATQIVLTNETKLTGAVDSGALVTDVSAVAG